MRADTLYTVHMLANIVFIHSRTYVSPFHLRSHLQELSPSLLEKIISRSVLVKSAFSLWAACDYVTVTSSNSPPSSSNSSPSSNSYSPSTLIEELVKLSDDLVGEFKAEHVKFRLTVEIVGG